MNWPINGNERNFMIDNWYESIIENDWPIKGTKQLTEWMNEWMNFQDERLTIIIII